MRYRLCGHTHEVCNCNDVESQPCIAALIADYLETLKMKTDGANGGPGDEMAIGYAERNLNVTGRSVARIGGFEKSLLHAISHHLRHTVYRIGLEVKQ